jgi:hypothetical protein
MEYAHPGWKPSLNAALTGAMVLDPRRRNGVLQHEPVS